MMTVTVDVISSHMSMCFWSLGNSIYGRICNDCTMYKAGKSADNQPTANGLLFVDATATEQYLATCSILAENPISNAQCFWTPQAFLCLFSHKEFSNNTLRSNGRLYHFATQRNTRTLETPCQLCPFLDRPAARISKV